MPLPCSLDLHRLLHCFLFLPFCTKFLPDRQTQKPPALYIVVEEMPSANTISAFGDLPKPHLPI